MKPIILDLDHCLIFASYEKIEGLDLIDQREYHYLYFRPDLAMFLRHIERGFRIIFYTSSKKEYAEWVISNFNLTKDYKLFTRKYTKPKETEFGVHYIKSLKKLKLKSVSDILVLDDRPDMWIADGVKFIDIDPWNGELHDSSLKRIMIAMIKERLPHVCTYPFPRKKK